MYTPDHGFVRKLKEVDQKLGCFFNRDSCLVVVTYERATGEPVPIYTVSGADGKFRVPDQRDIDKIREGDLERSSTKERLGKTAKYMEGYRAKHKKQTRDLINEATRDNKYQLKREIDKISNPGGKGNRPFRQLPKPKPKGIVFP